MSIYEIAAYFFVYGFLGWCTEVAFAAVKERRFVNRGFLNGPICPVYGFGVVSVTVLLAGVKDRLVILYITSVLLVTALEWLTGFILEKTFHHKWWDYSGMPLNLNGYVCLTFSLIWGVACVFIVKVFHPFVVKGVGFIPDWLLISLQVLLGIAIFADLYVTASGILKFNRHLERMDVIAKELHEISEEVGANIYKGVMETVERREEFQKHLSDVSGDAREKVEKLREDYRELAEKNAKHAKRLMKAFPRMESKNHKEAFKEIRERLSKREK